MPAPVMTFNAKGNIANAVSLAASASNGYPGDTNTHALDFSTKLEGQVMVEFTTGGTVAATAGLRVQIFAGNDATPDYESTAAPSISYQSPQPAISSTYRKMLFVPTGKWVVRVTNLDASNAISSYTITTATVDSIT